MPSIRDQAGIEVFYDRYEPSGAARAVVQVLHGWAEHAGRYEQVASELAGAGFVVYADDHRGHGRTGEAAGGLGDLGADAPDGILLAVRAVTQQMVADEPGLPVVLLGHSWGSFLAQQYVQHWGGDLQGVVLMGTTMQRPRGAARTGSLNDRFEPARTPYDWLTRDEAEVDKYVADPWCGFERVKRASAAERSDSARAGASAPPKLLPERTTADVPKDLAVLILNGSDDPVGGAEGGEALAAHYREAGVRDVQLRLYEGARHELFNETNRAEVIADLLAWLGRVVTDRARARPTRA